MRQSVQNLIFILAGFALLSGAQAAPSEVKLDKAEIRLLDGGQMSGQQRLAGIEMVLQSGVKTYWRMPGDSGLPPVFDFSASQNVASVEIKWPKPSRFTEADGTILGFKERVIFPFIVTPKNPAEPVTLAVSADFGLCDTLCLPAKAELTRPLSLQGVASEKAAIESFLAQVPIAAKINGTVQPGILSVTPEGKSLTLIVASDTALTDLILEASGSWFFGEATITPEASGRFKALVPIEQKPAAATLGGLPLTITAIAEGRASETVVTLDSSGSIR